MTDIKARFEATRKYKRLVPVLIVLICAALLLPVTLGIGTATQGKSDATTTTTAVVQDETPVAPRWTALGGAKPSGVEGFPIPAAATLSTASNSVFESYELPANTPLDVVRNWYATTLPDGQSHDEWAWCKSEPAGVGDAVDRVWQQTGSSDVVRVTTMTHDNTPFIIVLMNGDGKPSCV